MHLQTVGSGGVAAGNITATNGGTTYSEIAAGEARCSSSARMVPAGKTCYVKGAAASAISGTSASRVQVRLVASEIFSEQFVDPLVFFPFGTIGVQDNSISMIFPVPLAFQAGTVIALTATTDKAANIGGTWFGWTE